MITDGFWLALVLIDFSFSERSLAFPCSELSGKLTDTIILSPDVNTDFSAELGSPFFLASLDLELLPGDPFLCLALVFLDLDLLRDRDVDRRRVLLFFNCLDFPLFFDNDLLFDLGLDFSDDLTFFLFCPRDLLRERDPDSDGFRFLLFLDRLRDRIFFRIFSATGNFFFITIFLFLVVSFAFFPFTFPFFLDLDLELELELELEEFELDELELRLSEEEEEVDLLRDLLVNFLPRDRDRLLGFFFLLLFIIKYSSHIISL